MKRFAYMMRLTADDNPLACPTSPEEEMKAPLTERDKRIEAYKKEMNVQSRRMSWNEH